MTCAYMAAHPGTAAPSVFTVHNLAYQGLFAPGDFPALGLPSAIWASHGIEYHGRISFMKAGLKYARRITTVSPTYATEIATQEFGCGLDGVVRSRVGDVSGILNGVDRDVWDPASDSALGARYSASDASGKRRCRAELRAEFGLDASDNAPLFGVVSRLSGQKGLDLVLAALPALLRQGAQLCLQGSGDPALEAAFSAAAKAHPGQVAVRIGYDEITAHRVIAGADALLVPSRFEPCGLTQLYALRYGSVPVVRRVGGLADTVVDATPQALSDDRATGFTFDAATPAALEAAVQRAVLAFRTPAVWQQLMQRGMAQDFSWNEAASQYLALYGGMLSAPAGAPPIG